MADTTARARKQDTMKTTKAQREFLSQLYQYENVMRRRAPEASAEMLGSLLAAELVTVGCGCGCGNTGGDPMLTDAGRAVGQAESVRAANVRLRRNRNARGRYSVCRDLGLTRTASGWE